MKKQESKACEYQHAINELEDNITHAHNILDHLAEQKSRAMKCTDFDKSSPEILCLEEGKVFGFSILGKIFPWGHLANNWTSLEATLAFSGVLFLSGIAAGVLFMSMIVQ